MQSFRFSPLLFFILLFTLPCLFCPTVCGQKQVLDDNAYQSWRRVDGYQLSGNGKWVVYRYMFYDNKAGNELSEALYYLYDRKSGQTSELANVTAPEFFAGGDWLAYEQKGGTDGKRIALCLKNKREISCPQNAELHSRHPFVSYKTPGDSLIFKNLETNDSLILSGIGRYRLYEHDQKVIYTRHHADYTDICTGPVTHTQGHKTFHRDYTGSLDHFLFHEHQQCGQFQITTDSGTDFYYFSLRDGKTDRLLSQGQMPGTSADIHSVEVISDRFLRLTFQPPHKPQPAKGDRDDSFKLELWSWNDAMIPSQQAKSGYNLPRPRPAEFIYDRRSQKYHSLKTDLHTTLEIAENSDPMYAFKIDERPYTKYKDWQHDTRFDLYVVHLADGKEQLIGKALTREVRWSPQGDQILFFDNNTLSWVLFDPQTSGWRWLKDEIPFALHDELYDRPNPAPPYGIGGWSKDGRLLIVYDRYDIWVADLKKEHATYCLTQGYGRLHQTRFRMIDPGQNEPHFDLRQELYVTSSNEVNRNSGIYALTPSGKLSVRMEGAFDLKILQESQQSGIFLCMKQSYQDDRDLWISDESFRSVRKITAANPQKEKYKWGSVRQVEWINYEGKQNRGLLYFPEDYDSTRCYPAIVSFYETHTPEMHIHPVPGLSQALIDIPTYVGKGYIVFQPDVYFKTGHPGQSSYDAVVSGTKALIERGIIDSLRIGLQGHSWSGFQAAYLVTRTDLFKCVNIGAALTNFTSAYTALREESGIPCMLMYEDWQCRMGTALWDNLTGYIENSPVLYANKIHTPALIFHCDGDGSVSYYDGRNLFLALRRLQRPAWLLNYSGEGHSLTSRPAMADWTLRMEQFFDHYLKEAPMPRWMQEGIHIHERGYDQKYDLLSD